MKYNPTQVIEFDCPKCGKKVTVQVPYKYVADSCATEDIYVKDRIDTSKINFCHCLEAIDKMQEEYNKFEYSITVKH